MKKRENIRGFKDGNIKLIWDENLNNFAQIDKIDINKNLIYDNNGKDLKDNEVEKIFETIKNRLELPKQNNIKKALEDYEKRLLETRARINAIKDEIKQEENKLPRDKKTIDTQESLEIKEKIETLKINQKELSKDM